MEIKIKWNGMQARMNNGRRENFCLIDLRTEELKWEVSSFIEENFQESKTFDDLELAYNWGVKKISKIDAPSI